MLIFINSLWIYSSVFLAKHISVMLQETGHSLYDLGLYLAELVVVLARARGTWILAFNTMAQILFPFQHRFGWV